MHFVLTLDVQLRRESQQALDRLPVRAAFIEPEAAPAPLPHASFDERPVVVGRGPAGLFAAWTLAQAGARPIVLERGRDVDRRARDVQAFFSGGELDETSNVQFGEGGAGAFSDGKLNTGISDPRCRRVLETLHECGAPEEILYLAKPHVGTDRLPGVVKALRERIVSLGGTVLFEHRLSALHLENGRLAAIDVIGPARRGTRNGGLDADPGHRPQRARHLRDAVIAQGLTMIQKPFSLGARIEHPQSLVSRSQYGEAWRHPALGAADYKLSEKLPNGRSAYTFCMCPGGTVVAAASERGGVVTNGMSEFARDGKNANSALLVGVEPSDFGGDDPLAGVRLQQKWEHAAFLAGGENYRAPAPARGRLPEGRAVDERGRRGADVPAGRDVHVAGQLPAGLRGRDHAPGHHADGSQAARLRLAGRAADRRGDPLLFPAAHHAKRTLRFLGRGHLSMRRGRGLRGRHPVGGGGRHTLRRGRAQRALQRRINDMHTIQIKYHDSDLPRVEKLAQGNWIDLYCAQDMTLKAGDFALVPLGVSMQLPEGYEARTAPRSSTFKRWGLLQANSVGIIDNSYCGTNDEWKLPGLRHARYCVWKRATASASSGFSRSSPPLNSRSARRFAAVRSRRLRLDRGAIR